MRHILKERRFFCTSLRSVIRQKTKQMGKYDQIAALQFEKHLRNLMIDRQKKQKQANRSAHKYQSICLSSEKPVQTILKQFLQHSKNYQEEELVEAVSYLAKAYQMSAFDSDSALDLKEQKLYLSVELDHIIEEIKFGLSDKGYMSIPNTARIVNSLIDMRYCDLQIIKLVMVKIERVLDITEKEKINFEPRYYQIEKKDYYKSYGLALKEQLPQNQIFLRNLTYFEDKRKQMTTPQLIKLIPKQEFSNDLNYQNVIDLLQSLEKLNQGADKLIEAVISIRQQYLKMVKISNEYKVMRNPMLNYDLLEIEEKLIQMGLITIEDVRDPLAIAQQSKQIGNVENVLKVLMDRFKAPDFEDFLVTTKKKSEFVKQKKDRDTYEFSQLIQAFCRYVTLPNKLKGTQDHISALNVQWQTFFLGNQHNDQNLKIDRIFLRAFAEAHLFLNKHLPLLYFSIMGGSLKTKVNWFNALLHMGYYDDLFAHLENVKITPSLVQDLGSRQFIILVRVLNHTIQSELHIDSELREYLFQRIESLEKSTQEAHHLTHQSLCDLINYLYQIGIKNPSEQQLYQNLIKRLSQQASYLQNNSTLHPQQLQEVYRILSFEKKSNNDFQGLLQAIQPSNFDSTNPFHKTVLEICREKQVKAPEDNLPFILTGVNHENKQTGVYIVPSDCSSVSGEFVSGHIIAYCKRINEKMGIEVKPISINLFLQLKYSNNQNNQLLYNATVNMIEAKKVIELFNAHGLCGNEILAKFIRNLSVTVSLLPELTQAGEGIDYRVNKILNSMKKLSLLHSKERKTTLIKEFYARRAQLLISFIMLKRDLNLLTEKETKNLNELFAFQNQGKSLESTLQEIEEELQRALPRRESRMQDLSGQETNILKGQRLTINILQQQLSKTKTQAEFIDRNYLVDYRYAEYEDWKDILKKGTSFAQINLEQSSSLTQLLAMKFCPSVRETMASSSAQTQLYFPSYPLDWRNKYLRHSQEGDLKQKFEQLSEEARGVAQNSQECQQTTNFITNVQNFKRELKMTKNAQQICEYILSFKFIDTLLLNQTEFPQKGKLIERKPKQYFNYLETKHDKLYLESPFLEYIFNKIQKTETVKQKMHEKKVLRAHLQGLFKKGLITKKQYIAKIRQADQMIIAEMKKLRQKVLAHTNHHQILEDPRKLVTLEKDIDDLERVINSVHFYDQKIDEDLIMANGDYGEAMLFKRAQAQKNLILFKIFYQKVQGKVISEKQQKYLENWKMQVTNGIQKCEKNKKFTDCSLHELDKADKDKLRLQYSNIIKDCPDLSLSDLVLELNNFLDSNFISKMETALIGNYFSKTKSIPSSLFGTSMNKQFSDLSHEMERQIFDENSKFPSQEINSMIEMTKIFKTEGVSAARKYQIFYQNIEQDLEKINCQSFRSPLMKEYLKCKDYQYYNNYLPEDVNELKDGQISNMWKNLFSKEYSETTMSEIKSKVNQICKRMLAIRMNVPPYFGNLMLKILSHPKVDSISKQKLIVHLELYKVPLALDSSDLMALVANPSQKSSQQQLIQKMKQVSTKDTIATVAGLL